MARSRRVLVPLLGLVLALGCIACTRDAPGAPEAGTSSPSEAGSPSGGAIPSAPASVAPAPSEEGPASGPVRFHCFSWVHRDQFSTDCFRSREACLREKQAMRDGARDTAPCETREHAACTRVRRPEEALEAGREHCFGDERACGRYRSFVARNGLVTTECQTQ